ncbi:uncharacterized protein LOC122064565 [Macadamia integrifolia]|uniref:uncharacterized protein LOC122064565 n=1 Tax=Macadamia integrifolia TaxID=60698 RepID=UPI001C4EAE15|nr:uncharacterized protein LOC122064565 [Macadamia integrifolia]
MKALYWNIRGIKKAAARLTLRNILRDKRPDFLCIAEPMIPSDAFPTLFLNKLGFDPDFIHNERLGGVSNLWLLWRRGVAKPIVLSSSEQQISVSVQWAQEIFILSVVHAKCLRAARRELWTDLGRKFTWTNNRRRGHVSAVLDRSFCNEAWISYFQECHQFVLQRVASDHTPILVVSEGSERPKNYPFRFQRFWADHEGYLNAVKSSWEIDIPGSPMMVMAQKLKRLKVFLRSWAKEKFPNFNLEMMEAKKCMEEIHTEIDRDGISDSIYAKEADAKTRYLKALQNYEKLWAEKSRSRWRNQGDRCSKFFHISVKIRRMKNSIKSLKMVDGTLTSDKEQIKEYVAGYYEHFHKGTPLTNHMDLLQCIPNVLDEWDRGRLDGIPSDSEIKNAVWDLDPDSAPGPDGFPGAFYKSCWDIISSDLCKAIRWFFRTGFMPYGINNNFLVLIPKIEGALSLDKFRALCMGNFLCKIISKILAMRLSYFLPKIISEEQGAFQKGKIIHSNISLASELILVSARISVLLNGGPVGYFGVEKGLRQGDPISPMLSIIAEEVLCRGLSELLANNSIKALSGPRGAIIPTHILFADDVFIFSNASIRYVKNLNNFLSKYQSFSGQKMNLNKSKLFLGSVPASRKQAIAEELGISICNFPTRYLGVEIFKGRVKKESLIPILDKVKGRLAGWKGKILSMAGRVELVRSVILGMMNHSSAPAGTMADFLTWWTRKQKSVCCKEAWIMGLLTVADHIWRERNSRRHDGKERPARYLKQMILEDIQFAKPSTKGEVKTMYDLICCRKLGIPIQRSHPKSILEVFWCRPEANWIKLNFDGSSRGNPGRAGAGGIFRDHRGGVLGSYKIFMGISGVFEAEIEGLIVGLMRARELGISCLWVETDSSVVAISIQQNKIPWFALQRWIFLQPYLKSITWKITHNFREANSIADYLARDAAKTGISAINVDFPANIKEFIRRDADGRPNYRFD